MSKKTVRGEKGENRERRNLSCVGQKSHSVSFFSGKALQNKKYRRGWNGSKREANKEG